MQPQRHIIASAFSGITIWIIGKNLPAGIILFLSGVLPDIDHVLEFVIHRGIRGISVKKVYDAFSPEHELPFEKLYLFLHSIELVIFLWIVFVFAGNIYLMSFAAGYTLHMIMDIGGNNLSGNFYFFIWRMYKRFDVGELFGKSEKNKKEADDECRKINT